VEIDPGSPPVVIPAVLWNELCAHAVETLSEECCGLIGGGHETAFRTLYRCRNDMSQRHLKDPENFPRSGETAFYMNESDYLRAIDMAREKGETITAVYHSHVGVGAYFSELDQAFASQQLFPFPNARHVVISVIDETVKEMGSFQRTESGFNGRSVVPSPPTALKTPPSHSS